MAQIDFAALPDKDVRKWRHLAHAAFDPVWHKKKDRKSDRQKAHSRKVSGKAKERPAKFVYQITREGAYRWLANALEIPVEDCHIRFFDIATCKKVIEICGGTK